MIKLNQTYQKGNNMIKHVKNILTSFIILAGAFGSYIDKHSALEIGLLPDLSADKISSVGNAAGAGASMALLSKDCRKKAEVLAAEVEHIELSANPEFQEAYIRAMGF